MTEVLLFHHAQGLTPGCLAIADALRAAGHVVHTPDLYDGRTFTDLEPGLAYGREAGFEVIIERGERAASGLPHELVYAGFSMGNMPAQKLAQTRRGARGALLLHGCVPLSEFGGAWPAGVPLQIHTKEADDWGDVDVAQEIVRSVPEAELFLYPGDQHLFTDNSLPAYDPEATALVIERVLTFLARIP
jgi:dienelactone hydrolase